MDLTFTREEEAWRHEVRDFLDRELPPDKAFDVEFNEDEALWRFAFDFTKKVGAKGWIGLTWPPEYGGLGRSLTDRLIMMEEFGYRDAPLINHIGWGLAAGALFVGGTPEQKRRFLPPIARMETFWAEGLTEPDAGSDLASLTTRAVRDGDDWIINGQKTYTTWGSHADVLYLAARTNPEAPKHHGISIFCLDLGLPGVSFTPMYNLGGGRQNHTFLEDVRIPGDRLIGEEGKGWGYIMSSFYMSGGVAAGHTTYQRRLDDLVAYCKETTRHGRPLIKDPIVRQQLAELALIVEEHRLLAYAGLGQTLANRPPEFGGALGTVVAKEAKPRFAEICQQIVGPLSQLRSESRWAPMNGDVEAWYRYSFSNHAGGTSQVKRMVLAPRGLGLPR
jgi:alkylation response protein AidB-like acyl-CoA dehydrogenase